MVARGTGTVVNVSSVSAYLPTPYLAAYSSSKALVRSFTLAVADETAGTGVRVLALVPGVTASGQKTEDVLPEMARLGSIRTPEQVVTTAFRALRSGRTSVVDGRRYAAFARVNQLLPERAVLALARRLTKGIAAF